MSAQSRIAELGLVLPPPNKPIGNYVPFRIGGNILYLSGVGPRKPDGAMITGKGGARGARGKGKELRTLKMFTTRRRRKRMTSWAGV